MSLVIFSQIRFRGGITMATTNSETYEYISQKIEALKGQYQSLQDKKNDYVFNALAVKSTFYKNPAYELIDNDLENIIVDGRADGGADILLIDPNSESSDLIIGQAKFHKKITSDECSDTVNKMADFYLNMTEGHYENVSEKVKQRYLSLEGDIGDESKIKFFLFTCAPKNRIQIKKLEKALYSKLPDSSKFELVVLFDKDIIEQIKESESLKSSVESGNIVIDSAENRIIYNNYAAMVNVSAFSIKKLYSLHNTNLLARNLRYHVPGKDVDEAIENSINNEPELFWLKNNGITIVCDNFKFVENKIELTNFSIVNGGQTTFKIAKNKNISQNYDLYLPCKIVKMLGSNEDEKNKFSLEIAKATNSQKAIKPSDLKANAPEQIRFSKAMSDIGLFYQSKRGEKVPTNYRSKWLNSDITEIGKLCLTGIFQMPCTSRNKPSTFYEEPYYDQIFNGNQQLVAKTAKLCKELLYIDYYYKNVFLDIYKSSVSNSPNSDLNIQFASNARTVCTAFVMLASRIHQGNINNTILDKLFKASQKDKLSESDAYKAIGNISNVSWILPPKIFDDKAKYNQTLDKLFSLLIKHGVHDLKMIRQNDDNINASNYLKKDKSYIDILSANWEDISEKISKIFSNL